MFRSLLQHTEQNNLLEDGKEKIIETDKIVITINAINEIGDFFTLT